MNEYVVIMTGVVFAREVLMFGYGRKVVPLWASVSPKGVEKHASIVPDERADPTAAPSTDEGGPGVEQQDLWASAD